MREILLRVPRDSVGRPLPESKIKSGLKKLNPGIFFDVGGRLGMEHPYMDYRQGVYFSDRPDGRKHICSLDRGSPTGGLVVEVPIWSTSPEIVRVHWNDVSADELMHQPEFFPMPCFDDPDFVQIKRDVRDEVILCGWRHTFDKLLGARIPGVDVPALEAEFGICLSDRVEAVEVPEETAPWDLGNSADQPEDGEILEEMGEFEARPTVILPGD